MNLYTKAVGAADPESSVQSENSSARVFEAKLREAESSQTKAHDGAGNWFTRGMGVLQAGVGVLETVGGAAFAVGASETGIGVIAGGAVALHGVDDIQAGLRQAFSGKSTETFTQEAATGAAKGLGASPGAAMAIGMGVDLAAGGVAGGGEKAAVKAVEEGGKLLEDAAKTGQDAVKTGQELSDASKLEKEGEAVGAGAKTSGASASSASRPYSHIPDHPSAGPGKAFTASKKQAILEANEKAHGGVLQDDVTGEKLVRPQQHEKGVRPPDNEAHVDHIEPKSKGGSNSTSNAQVLSRKNNLAKGDGS